ncbi:MULTISPECIES: branched-chain amino acid transport system II carrier protein [unclassified Gemella]|uniref:branched-chain amino acid transport system II carrier protein n=1 Tax=unclassified Gemella TaxID=2624949 RepID=UPI001C04984F|nr:MULTISPECIES: branched-chain amino acid transport system II carrier protein [unclassified Gemella]MBU0278899.1 branched-chain amino acid transport system II carrier protein [Gemella sp. zg-1178]QWQ38594.1 branched-chain amino acid transport system II carrier protein [Gemella sp. zg-570]
MSKFLKNSYVTIGLMLFALFFGAGNLIFPAFLGAYSGENVWLAILGFCITGVGLPMLGVAAIAYSGSSDVADYAGRVSKTFGVFFAVALYLSIGPLFAIPRTGATSYSIGIEPIFGTSLTVKIIYALVFFGITYFLAINPSKIADRVGKFLTPSLLIVIGILATASYLKATSGYGTPLNSGKGVADSFADTPFVAGFIQGYGTLDTLASLAFAIIVINAAKLFGAKTGKEVSSITLKSGLLSVSLLAVVYIFIARIGAISQDLFSLQGGALTYKGDAISGGIVLSLTSDYFLGNLGQVVLAAIIFLACLTTSTGLVTACSEYFHRLMPKFSERFWVTLFTIISTLLYFNGLTNIIKWSVPVLYLLYPPTVILVFITFLDKIFDSRREVYATTVGFTFVPALYDSISTFSALTEWFKVPAGVTKFFTETVPLGNYSLGWLGFSLVGFVVSFIYVKVVKK